MSGVSHLASRKLSSGVASTFNPMPLTRSYSGFHPRAFHQVSCREIYFSFFLCSPGGYSFFVHFLIVTVPLCLSWLDRQCDTLNATNNHPTELECHRAPTHALAGLRPLTRVATSPFLSIDFLLCFFIIKCFNAHCATDILKEIQRDYITKPNLFI